MSAKATLISGINMALSEFGGQIITAEIGYQLSEVILKNIFADEIKWAIKEYIKEID